MKFLKQNWVWIIVPIFLVAIAFAALVLLGPDAADPNAYKIR